MSDNCCDEGIRSPDDGNLEEWQCLRCDDAAPFIHRFQTRRQRYVFDVNTRRIIRVSPAVYDVLEDYGTMEEDAIVRKHASAHGQAAIVSAVEEIKAARDRDGFFLSRRPGEVTPPLAAWTRKQLDSHRQQLTLNVTDDCNFRCSYCVYSGSHRHWRTHSTRNMSWDTARAAIDDFMLHSEHSSDRAITFYGGEPLLVWKLIEQCVTYAKERFGHLNPRFSLTTNGYLLKGQAADFLARERFVIMVSLDGPSNVHDRHRRTAGGEPTWKAVTDNIRAFLLAYPEYRTNDRLHFSAVATPDADLRELRRYFGLDGLFTDDMGLEISGQTGARAMTASDPVIISRNALYAEFLRDLAGGSFASSYRDRRRWVESTAFQKPFLMLHKRTYLTACLPLKMSFLNMCVPGARRTFVNAGGDYYACERVTQSPDGNIGNVTQGMDAGKVIRLLDHWNDVTKDACRHCWCLSSCQVGCLATIGKEGSITKHAKQQACTTHRRSMHHVLIDYCQVLEENPAAFEYMTNFGFS